MTITVIGEPAPQGSKRHVGNGVMIESSKKVKPWRISVEWAAREAMSDSPMFTGPVTVAMTFYLRRPKSAPKKVTMPFRKPDLDKLQRSTLDALVTAGVLEDDGRVVHISAAKVFACNACADGLNVPGAIIQVAAI